MSSTDPERDEQDNVGTALLPIDDASTGASKFDADAERPGYRWHGGLDLGLLVLRVVVGGTVGAHGLQKIFGLFDGPGIEGFAKFLDGLGFAHTTELAYVTGWTEIVGGGFLVLGLLTPFAAAGVLGVLGNALWSKHGSGFFSDGGGFEYDLVLCASAFALLFTGAGRVSMDIGRSWSRRAHIAGWIGLLVAVGATVAVFCLARK